MIKPRAWLCTLLVGATLYLPSVSHACALGAIANHEEVDPKDMALVLNGMEKGIVGLAITGAIIGGTQGAEGGGAVGMVGGPGGAAVGAVTGAVVGAVVGAVIGVACGCK